jgi:hypothetical protein
MANPANASLFPLGFPLVPEVILESANRTGALKAGSGRYFLLRPGGSAREVLVSGGAGSPNQPARDLVARLALLRLK